MGDLAESVRELERKMRRAGDRLLALATQRDAYDDVLRPRTRGPHGPWAWVRPLVRIPTRGALDAERYDTLTEALGLVREAMARCEGELDDLASELRTLIPARSRTRPTEDTRHVVAASARLKRTQSPQSRQDDLPGVA
jgi:hypothetical protein